jgi:uncharacterized protein
MTKKALETPRHVNFVWHGGEPLLMGMEFYEKAMRLQQTFGYCRQVSNAIQTNGTLLDEKWLDFFETHQFSIGLSIDGPAELHNRNRVLANGRGSFDLVNRAVALMRDRNHPFGVLSVVTDETVRFGARRFLEFFIENDFRDLAMLCHRPALSIGKNDHLPRKDHSRFMNEIFDLWYERDDPNFHIRDFESIIKRLLGGQHSSCLLTGECIGRYFGVNAGGDVFHCDEFMFNADYSFGNVVREDFKGILCSDPIRQLSVANSEQITTLACEWLPICHGGCPKDRYVASIFSGQKRVLCCGFAELIQHIAARLSQDTEVSEIVLSNTTRPA